MSTRSPPIRRIIFAAHAIESSHVLGDDGRAGSVLIEAGHVEDAHADRSLHLGARGPVEPTETLTREAPAEPRDLFVLERDVGRASVRAQTLEGRVERVRWDGIPRDRHPSTVKADAAALLYRENDRARWKGARGIPSRQHETRFQRLQIEHLAAAGEMDVPRPKDRCEHGRRAHAR